MLAPGFPADVFSLGMTLLAIWASDELAEARVEACPGGTSRSAIKYLAAELVIDVVSFLGCIYLYIYKSSTTDFVGGRNSATKMKEESRDFT